MNESSSSSEGLDEFGLTVEVSYPAEKVAVLRCAGELDTLTAPLLAQRIDAARPAARAIVLDFAEVSFLGSPGLSVLVEARAGAGQVPVLIAGPLRRTVLRSLEMTGLVNMFDIHDSSAEAVAAFSR